MTIKKHASQRRQSNHGTTRVPPAEWNGPKKKLKRQDGHRRKDNTWRQRRHRSKPKN
ncbi:N-acetyltransferase [Sesbania bispinosa]|nr:N-acetyltransferase [Sesbania bispinosa]